MYLRAIGTLDAVTRSIEKLVTPFESFLITFSSTRLLITSSSFFSLINRKVLCISYNGASKVTRVGRLQYL